jgi:hypothetical protein
LAMVPATSVNYSKLLLKGSGLPNPLHPEIAPWLLGGGVLCFLISYACRDR